MFSDPATYHFGRNPHWTMDEKQWINLNSIPAVPPTQCSPSDWAQAVPPYMPWSGLIPNHAASQSTTAELGHPSVVRFGLLSSEAPPAPSLASVTPMTPIKRKHVNATQNSVSSSDDDDDIGEISIPRKLCATEENVITRLGIMNIGKVPSPPTITPIDNYEMNGDEEIMASFMEEEESSDEEKEDSPSKLVFSDEIQKALSGQDLVDRLIKKEAEKSSLAVILWTPPKILIEEDNKSDTQSTESICEAMEE